MKKYLFLLSCSMLICLSVSAQDLDIHLGDSLGKLMPKLKLEQQYLHIKYYHTIVNVYKVIIDVDHIPDGVNFGGLQVLAKKYTFYKMRLENAMLVLNKGADHADISQSISYKYGKSKVKKDNDEMWATNNMLIFLYETDSMYCVTYKDRKINAQEAKDRSSDF